MRIIPYHKYHPKIEIITIMDSISDDEILAFQKYLFSCLDKGKLNLIINLKHINKFDVHAIDILNDFTHRGMHLCLFNVRSEMFGRIEESGIECNFRIYEQIDTEYVIYLFEKEIGVKVVEGDTKKRLYSRIDTLFPVDFKYLHAKKGIIMVKANIVNLSEGGVFADQILTVGTNTEEIIPPSEISGLELSDMKFRFDKHSNIIETKAECIREFRNNKKLSAGIRFKDMKHVHKIMIKNYVIDSS